MSNAKIEDMLGKTLIGVDVNEGRDVIDFATTDGEKFCLYHTQDCCETVDLLQVGHDQGPRHPALARREQRLLQRTRRLRQGQPMTGNPDGGRNHAYPVFTHDH